MKKLDTSPITVAAQFRFKSGTLDFLQLAYQEAIQALALSIINANYDATKVYILYGCSNTGSGSHYIISVGAVLYNGEVFLVPAADFTISGSNVAEGVITTTQYTSNADPVLFTDGINYNVHNIRQIVMQAGLSGSGAGDYIHFIDLNKRLQGGIGQITEFGIAQSDYSTYFDGTGLGIHAITLGWAACNGSNGTVDKRGLVSVGYKSTDSDFNTLRNTGGEKTHVLTVTEMPSHNHDATPKQTGLDSSSAGGSDISGLGHTEERSAIAIANTGGGGAHNNLQPYIVSLFVQRIV